jgi:hypothetical protein
MVSKVSLDRTENIRRVLIEQARRKEGQDNLWATGNGFRNYG